MQGTEILRSCPWMLEARRLIGTKETMGPGHTSTILRMWEAIKAPFRDDETPWCAAYVGACLEAANIKSTRSATARSYAAWGEPVTGDLRLTYGAIVVLKRPGSAWSGHVGFLTGYDPHHEVLQLLGGNQDNQVKFAEYPLARVMAVRWPADFHPQYLLKCPPFYAKGATSGSDA